MKTKTFCILFIIFLLIVISDKIYQKTFSVLETSDDCRIGTDLNENDIITENEYFKLLDDVFNICSDKLKNGGYFCMYFHDSSLEVWNKLINSLSGYKLQYLGQAHIAKSNTLKNIISPKKSLNGDCILFFKKTQESAYKQDGAESAEEIEKNIACQSHSLVRKFGALSTPELYDNGLMEILIQNGWLKTISQKYKSLVEIFEKHLKWDADTAKWVL